MSMIRRAWYVSMSAVALVATISGPVAAQSFTLNKCSAGKKKCVATKVAGLLKCHEKSESKGVPVDDKDCVTKAIAKFDGGADPTKGCFAKLELKYPAGSESPCLTSDDLDAIETVVDTFVDDVVHAVDPAYPAVVVSACAAGKKKCISAKAVGLLKCHQKAETKGVSPNDKGCLDKVQGKYDGGTDPTKGCFAKLEAKGGCPTSMDTVPVGAQVDTFVDDVVTLLDPGASTTTTIATSTTTATTSTTTTTKPTTTTTMSTTTIPTTSTTTTTLGGGVTCTAAGINARVSVPYNTVGAPLLSGIRLRVHYPGTVSLPNIPGTSFVDSARLTSLTGVNGGFLIGQDVDTNADSVEDTLDVLYGVTGTTFPAGDFVRVLFDCTVGSPVSPSNFQCVVNSASDQVGNDVPNPASIPCSVVEVSTP
jgi:hypothetical protein